MEKQDGRSLSRSALEERRKTIIRMKEAGKNEREIIEATGCSRQTIYPLWNKWKSKRKNKEAIFHVEKRGPPVGEYRTLTSEQEKQIKRKIIDTCPEQLKLDFALWTRSAVGQLIKHEYGIEMPVRTVGEYLNRWGFTPQKPVKVAYERNPTKVKEWLKTTFPQIKAQAKEEKAGIYWGDETGLFTSDVRGRGFSPRGQTPVIQTAARHEKINMISAISNKGKVHWMIVEETVTAAIFREFVKRLMKSIRGKIFLILDNSKVHHSIELNAWIGKRKRIKFFFLPAYSPDLNPDEHLNADVKQGVSSRVPAKTKEKLHTATEEHMQMLRNTPGRIVKYFEDPAISYASNA